MAEKNVIDPSNVSDLTPTSDYISHHLTNLTYGWCDKTESWGFIINNLFSRIVLQGFGNGFWAFRGHNFYVIYFGYNLFRFFGLAIRAAKTGVPGKIQTLQNMFLNSLVIP